MKQGTKVTQVTSSPTRTTAAQKDYLLGNIAEGRTLLQLAVSPQQAAFGNAKLDALPKYCHDCDVRFACNGGCPKDRFLTTPDGEPGLHYLCAGYQRFFRHIDEPMRVMADLLRRGADATGVKNWYADRDAERGRSSGISQAAAP